MRAWWHEKNRPQWKANVGEEDYCQGRATARRRVALTITPTSRTYPSTWGRFTQLDFTCLTGSTTLYQGSHHI